MLRNISLMIRNIIALSPFILTFFLGEFKRAIDQLMDEREAGQERRKRANELGEMAKMAIDQGSSHLNMKFLIQEVMQQVISKMV